MNRDNQALRVCIDARLDNGTAGGVQQVVISLAAGLGRLRDGDEHYLFLTSAGSDEWLRPHLGGNAELLEGPPLVRRGRTWRSALATVPGVRTSYGYARLLLRSSALALPRSDGLVEAAGAHVLHFPTQLGFVTRLPTIYQPWDLQHRHLRHFFTPDEYVRRESWYRALCAQAACVIVATSWAKHDLMAQYGLDEAKIEIVPVPPVVEGYVPPTAEEVAQCARKHGLPGRFIFYPAQTWAHKNHLRLLEALALLRARGHVVNLVLTGASTNEFRRIEGRIDALGLRAQVRHLGYVSPLELQALYLLCRCLVFPSTFEGWGMPIAEAFRLGCPVACSNVTSLPELAGDAALIFDPYRPASIAEAVERLWVDDQLCRTLVARGKGRVASLSLERMARTVRAHYRRLGGRSLDADERALLAAAPLV